jgi:hypothetical protein
MRSKAIIVCAGLAAGILSACGGGDEDANQTQSGPAINPADFQTAIDNPLYPLSPGEEWTYEGEEVDPDTGETFTTRVEVTVLSETDTVAGVEVVVVRDRAFEDGELVEETLDYYAQHKDGSVYYFGERVDNYEDGEVVNHDGSWLANEGDNQPGIAMPAAPDVGAVFEQEKAPGIAEDRSTVLSAGETVTVTAGTFEGCIKTKDENPLDNATETKFFCPGVGFVREEFEEGDLSLVSQ